jgi:hypothetical protein
LGKVVFEGNRRWLNRNHPYRIHPIAQHFNGHEELRGRPDIITAAEVKDKPTELKSGWLQEMCWGQKGLHREEVG